MSEGGDQSKSYLPKADDGVATQRPADEYRSTAEPPKMDKFYTPDEYPLKPEGGLPEPTSLEQQQREADYLKKAAQDLVGKQGE